MAIGFKKIFQTSISAKRRQWFSISLVPLTTFLVIAFLTALVILPRVGAILALRKVVSEKETKIAKLMGKLDGLNSLAPLDIQNDLRVARRALPDNKDVLEAVIAIQNIALEEGVQIIAFNTTPGTVSEEEEGKGAPVPSQPTSSPQEGDIGLPKKKEEPIPQAPKTPIPQTPQASQNQLELNFSIMAEEGGERNSFEKLNRFIERVFRSRRVFAVKSVSFSSAKAGGSLSLSFSLLTFFQPLPKEIGPIDSPLSHLNNEEKNLLLELSGAEATQEVTFPKPQGKGNPFR